MCFGVFACLPVSLRLLQHLRGSCVCTTLWRACLCSTAFAGIISVQFVYLITVYAFALMWVHSQDHTITTGYRSSFYTSVKHLSDISFYVIMLCLGDFGPVLGDEGWCWIKNDTKSGNLMRVVFFSTYWLLSTYVTLTSVYVLHRVSIVHWLHHGASKQIMLHKAVFCKQQVTEHTYRRRAQRADNQQAYV